jgi:nicotinamide mononucleotide transporter
LTVPEIYQQLIVGLKATTWLEFVAVAFGIISVLLSRKEHIWVYPTGIINTVLFTWFCFKWWGLYAEGSLNFYYTIMSIYGWYLWGRKTNNETKLKITWCSTKERLLSVAFFILCYIILYAILKKYTPSTVPFADAFASAAAYTAMLLMARKKIDNWVWWCITNIISIPLYFYKGAVFTSFQYLVFFVLAIMGFITWKNKVKKINHA